MQPASRAPSRHTFRTLWDEWREGDVARLHRLYTEGNRTAAAELAQRMLRRDEADAEAHHVLGLLAYHDQRLGEADTHLRCAIARSPAQAELHANHAAILRKLGRLADAEAAARSALELEPGSRRGAQQSGQHPARRRPLR